MYVVGSTRIGLRTGSLSSMFDWSKQFLALPSTFVLLAPESWPNPRPWRRKATTMAWQPRTPAIQAAATTSFCAPSPPHGPDGSSPAPPPLGSKSRQAWRRWSRWHPHPRPAYPIGWKITRQQPQVPFNFQFFVLCQKSVPGSRFIFFFDKGLYYLIVKHYTRPLHNKDAHSRQSQVKS